MSFNVEKETKYDDLEHCFYLNVEKNDEGLIIDAEIFSNYDYTKHYVCDSISHDDAIRLRDYLNEVYPQWISVDERLPTMYQRVLVKSDSYVVAGREPISPHHRGWGVTGEWIWTIVNDVWLDSDEVTHWQPLPEPPKEANDE